MKKSLVVICVILISVFIFDSMAQQPTLSFAVSGKIKTERKISNADLKKFKTDDIIDVVIANHKGEVKGTAKGMKGVLLRDVLQDISLDTENPKLFSEYYYVCTASDGYKVVYSWNELFNTTIGNSVYIVLEKDHKALEGSEDNILMISTLDQRTGRRYVKNLQTIYVGRAQ
jgi:hypothetical protein